MRPWRSAKEQQRYEESFPDRFEGADEWITLAERARGLVGDEVFGEREASIRFKRPMGIIGAVYVMPQIEAMRDAYESARLRARYASLAGTKTAIEYLNRIRRMLRETKDPTTAKGLIQANYVIEQYLRDPDKRAPWSKLLMDLDYVGPGGRYELRVKR